LSAPKRPYEETERDVTIDDLIAELEASGDGWWAVQTQPGSLDVGLRVDDPEEGGELTLCPVYTLASAPQQGGVVHMGTPYSMGLFLDDAQVSYPHPLKVLDMSEQSADDRRRVGGLVRKAEELRVQMHAEAYGGIKLVKGSLA
jgi:hypothetical protein